MPKTVLLLLLLLGFAMLAWAQPGESDTFFLVKKKGLLGKLGRSISTAAAGLDTATASVTEIKPSPYARHIGKVIRHIKIVRLGFERDINDTTKYNNNFANIAANAFHKKTKGNVIANNLFFDAGDRLNPYLMADNEKFLRDQPYLQDALITIDTIPGNKYMVDVNVIVKDVFSIGGAIDMGSTKLYRIEAKEENLKGTGSRLLLTALYDGDRKPKMGFGAEFLKRNIIGTFVNAAVGFKSFNNAFNSTRREESVFYVVFDKPFITPYLKWIGGLSLSYNHTKNNYVSDSLYEREIQYSYQRADGWIGYNFGGKKQRWKKQDGRVRVFAGARGLYQHFVKVPGKVLDTFDYRFGNVNGVLASVSMVRQNFTRSNFIYGFGRNEDLPEGFSASVIGGYINRIDSLGNRYASRPYYAFEGQRVHLNNKGFFHSYTVRIGGYMAKGQWQDVDILLGMDRFTRRKKLGPQWYYRQFYSVGFARQINGVLNQPLVLSSQFGLPYFRNGFVAADLRLTAKTEAVFYNLHKFWGFRLAPFVFTDVCLVKQKDYPLSKSDLYTAIGGGVRTRNESLVFGTIELKGYYFPRTMQGMSWYLVELNSNIRFRYNNVLVKKPDFIQAN